MLGKKDRVQLHQLPLQWEGLSDASGEHREAQTMLSSWDTPKTRKVWLGCFVLRTRTVNGIVLRTVQEFIESKDAWVFFRLLWPALQRQSERDQLQFSSVKFANCKEVSVQRGWIYQVPRNWKSIYLNSRKCREETPRSLKSTPLNALRCNIFRTRKEELIKPRSVLDLSL